MIEAPQQRMPALRGSLVRLGPLAAGWRPQLGKERRRWLLCLLLCCVVLAALPFGSHPGQILADTKIDLAINPGAFLRRALHLWDPAQFGMLQDQAVGYFFPIGPFFLVLKLAGIPAWVIQRLWITFILMAAFLGIVRLARLLGIGSPASQIVAGLSYALAPEGLSLLGSLSSEFLPIAMLPWILIPLVRVVQAQRSGARTSMAVMIRAAAQSAVAVALCSGINAAATAAVLIPPVILLLTASRPAPRWRLLAWWAAAVLLATFWWLYPLLLENKYGVSILPYTESAATTTAVTSLSNALRGTENWITYLVVDGQPWWPAGFRISTGTLATIVTGLIAGLGLTGLVSWRQDEQARPHRRFLLCVLLAGVFLILTGYVSALGNPLAGHLDQLINGALAPLRNLRKFDPLIRLPVAMGLAALLAQARPSPLWLPAWLRRPAWLQPRGWLRNVSPRVVVIALATASIALLAVPVYIGGLSTPGSFGSVPAYWVSAANWLNQHAADEGVLEEPGARFGQYTWGSPMDDILEPLFDGDFASSQLSDIGSVGNTRLLEAIDQDMAAGTGSAGLTELMARMGVKYLVVRNDLDRSDLRGAWPARIHEAIAESPGLAEVAHFGSTPAGDPAPANAVSSFDAPYPPVQIYQVGGAESVALVQPTADTMRVYGAPEALLTLADEHLLQNRPVLLNDEDSGIRASSTVVTDSLRRRVRNFGEIRDDYSPTLTASQPLTTFEAAADYTEPSWQRYEAVAQYGGIANVTASSSASDIDAIPSQSGTGLLPYAAVDGNLSTMWESGSLGGPVGQWIRVDLLHALDPGTISVAFAHNLAIGPMVESVRVTTAGGQVVDHVARTGRYQRLSVPPGPTTWLQITIRSVYQPPSDELGRQVGIAEIAIPGVSPTRTIEAPDVTVPGGGDPSAVVLAKAEPQPSGCMPTSQLWVCSPELEKSTEEQYGFSEGFTVPLAATADLSGSAVLTNPALIQRYAFTGASEPQVTASSTYTSDPEDQAWSAFDGSLTTSWISGGLQAHPTLTIRWRATKQVGMVTVVRPPGVTGALPIQVTGSGGQVRSGVIGGPGPVTSDTLTFAPMATSSLTLSFTASGGPVQISEVGIPGVPSLSSDAAARITLPCGLGPKLEVNGKAVPTTASGTVAEILHGVPLSFSACKAVAMAAGHNRVVEPDSDAFSVQSVVLDRHAPQLLTAAAPAPAEPARVLRWTDASRVLRVSAAQQSYLIVNENLNAGWQAAIGGRALKPVQLDGWKQGWLLPAGTRGLVTLTYLPDASYRGSLLGGLAALLTVICVAFAPLRRRRVLPEPAEEVPTGPAAGPPAPVAPAPAVARTSTRARSHRRIGLALVAGLAASCLFGLWIGGEPGAGLLPIATAAFMVAVALREDSWICRMLASAWLVAFLMLAAAVSGFVGQHLTADGSSSGLASALSNAVPQLLCVTLVGRLIAALLLADSDRVRRHEDGVTAGRHASPRGR
jgi:arabinofuranan 3-O-arabinosyltransferase